MGGPAYFQRRGPEAQRPREVDRLESAPTGPPPRDWSATTAASSCSWNASVTPTSPPKSFAVPACPSPCAKPTSPAPAPSEPPNSVAYERLRQLEDPRKGGHGLHHRRLDLRAGPVPNRATRRRRQTPRPALARHPSVTHYPSLRCDRGKKQRTEPPGGERDRLRAAPSPGRTTIFSSSTCCFTKAAPPQKSDADGAASLPSLFDRRCRATCTFRATPSFPNDRVGAPSPTQTSGAKRRLPGGRRSFRVRCVV